jgi:hypothetical protein
MYVTYYCAFLQDCLARTDYGDECELLPTMCKPSMFGKSFSFGEERI